MEKSKCKICKHKGNHNHNEDNHANKKQRVYKSELETIDNAEGGIVQRRVNSNLALLDAILNPRLSKGVRFPSHYNIPTYDFQLTATMDIVTNNNGCCFVQVVMGEVLNTSSFRSSYNSTQGTYPSSNIFRCAPQSWNGDTIPNFDWSTVEGINKLMINDNLYSAVRCGPCLVEFDYNYRFDIASGNCDMGLEYSFGNDRSNLSFSKDSMDLNVIQDNTFSRRENILSKMRAIYIPHTAQLMDYKTPGRTDNLQYIPQRLNIMFTNAPQNAIIGTLRFVFNLEGTPTPLEANTRSVTYNTNNKVSEMQWHGLFETIQKNGLIISTSDKEYDALRHYLASMKKFSE